MGVVNQKSCFTCPFRNKTSADIRLGDYWGERFKKNEEGVSMILVNSLRGLDLLNAISKNITLNKQDITDRLGQQHIDYEYPKCYSKSLEMLKDCKTDLKCIVNLYESDFDRCKKILKKIVKKAFGY